ncbi:hypothetical protein K2X33_09145 [bacterium]|nr:hypothetical protein [bacterium]
MKALLVSWLLVVPAIFAEDSAKPFNYLQNDYFDHSSATAADTNAILGGSAIRMYSGRCYGRGVENPQAGLLLVFKQEEQEKFYIAGSLDSNGNALPEDFYDGLAVSQLLHFTKYLSYLAEATVAGKGLVMRDTKTALEYDLRQYPSMKFPLFGKLSLNGTTVSICYFTKPLTDSTAAYASFSQTTSSRHGSNGYFQYGYWSGERFIPTAVPVYSTGAVRAAPPGVLRGKFGYQSGRHFIPTAVPVLGTQP